MSTVAVIVAALILSGWLYWLTARVQLLLSHVESAADNTDQAVTAVHNVVHHLAETEPAGTGRHAG